MSTTSEPTVKKPVGEDWTEPEFRSTKDILEDQLVALKHRQELLVRTIKEAKEQQAQITVEVQLTHAALAVAIGEVAEMVQEPLVPTTTRKRRRKSPTPRPANIGPRYKLRSTMSREEADERDLLQQAIIEFAESEPNPGEVTVPEVTGYLSMKGLGDYRKGASGAKEIKLRSAIWELADTGVLRKDKERVFATPTRENTHKGRKADLYRLVPRTTPRESETKEADLAST